MQAGWNREKVSSPAPVFVCELMVLTRLCLLVCPHHTTTPMENFLAPKKNGFHGF